MSILLWPWLFLASAWATADCARPLTADRAYARLSSDPGVAFDRAVVTLVNQTLEPILREIHARVAALGADDVRRVAARLPIEIATHHPRPAVEPDARALGYDRAYAGFVQGPGGLTAAFTLHNAHVMRRLLRAAATAQVFTDAWRPELEKDPEWRGGAEVMRRHSASRHDLADILSLATDSVLQAAAQLTASPVDDLSAAELVPLIFARERTQPSLLNALALALPPGLIGPNGDFFYVKNPLELGGGRLRFADHFRQMLRRGREGFRARLAQPWETGRGCPVAHAHDAGTATALDQYLGAILKIYDWLGTAD